MLCHVPRLRQCRSNRRQQSLLRNNKVDQLLLCHVPRLRRCRANYPKTAKFAQYPRSTSCCYFMSRDCGGAVRIIRRQRNLLSILGRPAAVIACTATAAVPCNSKTQPLMHYPGPRRSVPIRRRAAVMSCPSTAAVPCYRETKKVRKYHNCCTNISNPATAV